MIYFDHAATTPVDKGVTEAMKPYFSEVFGNPSSIYKVGRDAKESIFQARKAVAEMLGATSPTEIIFTSGATESNNLAIKGVYFYAQKVLDIKPHIIISSIEHHCVLDSVKYLEKYFEADVTYLPVDCNGLVSVDDVQKSIKENTILVSVMYGNNETGSVEPISEIGGVIARAKKSRKASGSVIPIYFHTDAVQAFQYLNTNVMALGVDLLSLTGHKFYGPKGVGLLYVKSGTKLLPQQQGGAQERNRRAGTENVPYIIGFAKALELADRDRSKNHKKISSLTEQLIERVKKDIPDTLLLGPQNQKDRLPHIAAFLFKRIEGESILLNLDMEEIAASSGSACTSGSLEPSHVTKAMGYADMDAHGAVRFSLGKLNSQEDIDKLMSILPKVVEKLRAMSPIK
jgi:cysteine desulfurase